MKIQTVIIEDEIPALERMKKLLNDINVVVVIGEAMDGLAACRLIDERDPDLVFLDIKLPFLDGFEILEKIKKQPNIIFVTAYDKYAIKAFEVNAVDYLLKPFSEVRLKDAINKIVYKIASKENTYQEVLNLIEYNRERNKYLEHISIKHKFKYRVFDIQDILFFRVENGLVFMYANSEKYIVNMSLAALEEKLNPSLFFRSQRGVLINLHRVKNIIPWGKRNYLLEFSNNERVKLSRNYAPDFKRLMGF